MARRTAPAGRQQGQIIPRGDNKYLIRVYVGTDADGKRKYSSKTITGTISQAKQARTKMLRELDTGTFISPSKQTAGAFIVQWAEQNRSVSDRTRKHYTDMMRRYCAPVFGQTLLADLAPLHIQGVLSGLESRGVSPRTVQYTLKTLKQALDAAVDANLLRRNPCRAKLVKTATPKVSRTEMATLTAPQVNHFLGVASGDHLEALFHLLLKGGLRPQEALGLRWSDVDGSGLSIQRAIVKQGDGTYTLEDVKTEKSRRRVDMDADSLEILTKHRARQARLQMQSGVRSDLVFCTAAGGVIDPPNARRSWHRLLRKAKLPALRLYDARHTHATLLLEAGVHPKVVSERLGHTSVQITLDTYSHVLPSMQKDAVSKLMGSLQAAIG